jgi:immune inhibitor A
VTRWISLVAFIIGLVVVSNGRCAHLLQYQTSVPISRTVQTPPSTPSPRPTATNAPIPVPSATAISPLQMTATPVLDPRPITTHPTLVPDQVQAPTSVPLEAIEVPPRDPLVLAAQLQGMASGRGRAQPPSIPRVVNATPPAYDLGDQELFWVGNTDTSEQYQITATLRAMTPHLYMWVEDGHPMDQAELERSAQRFEESTYPTNRALFGSEWTPGVDNDVRLTILNTHRLGRSVAGYYSSADEFSRLVNPFSNEREMFYINLDVLRPGTRGYDSTLAHEFQHMIHWAKDRNEDTWVSEGFSTLAEYLNDYGPGTYSESYLRASDTQLTAWALTDQPTLPHYGASFLFSLYFWEHFGEDGVRRVVAEQADGTAGFDALLASQQLSFDDVFADWIVANYLDNAEVGEGRYGYEGLNLPSPQCSEEHSTYPTQQRSTVHQYGADYILLEGEGDLRVVFQGAPEVRVVPNRPHSGRYQWWSNYGDESDMTLTRAFDLSGLDKATLEVWLWFDTEEGWDYAYVEVSVDKGQSWQILAGEHTTDYNPNGNAFGVGYSGRSGGGQEPIWVKERIDLSLYTGQEILLRFEYITDDAVNHPGLCVDDVAIPELGYLDNVEAGLSADTGWEAAGFVRTDNRLEQHFVVQIIELTDPPEARRMRLNGEQEGEILVQGMGQSADWGGPMGKAVLVVGGLTPVTMETATYTYTVESLLGDN